jgi:hypothetical protein
MASMSMPNDKPRALVVIEENIPQEMKDRPKQWVLWRYIYKPKVKKWTKPPFQPDKSNADSTNSDTWYSYATVIAAYHASDGFFDGIGFVFNGDYTGIDIDHTTDAQALINDTASYAELSPSGTGVHIITRGPVTTDGKGKRDHERGIELYDTGRYFTVTGHKLSSPIAATNGAVKALYNSLIKPPEKPVHAPNGQSPIPIHPILQNGPDRRLALDTLRVQELLGKNNGFAKLWRGNWQGYNSASEGAYGLLTDLLAVTRMDKDAAIYQFKQSPFYALNPEKYDRTLQSYDVNGATDRLLHKLADSVPKTLNPITVLTEAQADSLQAPAWVLEGIIVKGEISMLSGKKGSFKTFEAIHQTLKVAQVMNTLYIAAEDPVGVSLRRQAWRKHYQCTTGVMLTIPQAIKFHDPHDCNNLLDLITLYSIGHVTVDTIAACSRGLNENDAKDMGTVLEGLERIRDQSGVNILVLAHESSKQANGIRGWSGIGDASYVELSAQRQEKSNVVTLKGVRTKNALEKDFTHSLIEVDNTLVVTELVNPIFQYPQKERIKLVPRDIILLTAIAASGTMGLMRHVIMERLAPTLEQRNSIQTGLNTLKRKYAFITQDQQGTPYTITNEGLQWLQELEQD